MLRLALVLALAAAPVAPFSDNGGLPGPLWPTLQGAGKKRPAFSFTAPVAGAYSSLTAATGQTITCARASTGTYQTSATALASAASGQFRVDYRGLLVEESRTNSALQSHSLSTTPWATFASAGNAVAVSTDGTLGPDGLSASLLTYTGSVTTTGQYFFDRQSFGAVSNTVSLSAWVKQGTLSTLPYNYGNANNYSTPVTSAWAWFSKTFTSTTTLYIDLGANGNNGQTQGAGTVYATDVQSEVGPFATSYIPTTTTAVTRSADVVDVGAVTLSATPSLSATVNLEGLPASGTATVLDATDGTNSFVLAIDTSGHAKCSYGASSDTTAGTVTPGTASKVVCKYDGTTISACIGSTCHGTTAALSPVTSYTHLYVGSTGSAAYLNGFLSTICAAKTAGGC